VTGDALRPFRHPGSRAYRTPLSQQDVRTLVDQHQGDGRHQIVIGSI
jgi:hypothetical protein